MSRASILLLGFVFVAARLVAQPTDYIAYYPFNGNADNEVESNRNGTEHGGVSLTADRFGVENSAYNFDGDDDYISLPAADYGVGGTNKATYVLWFNARELNEFGQILSIGNPFVYIKPIGLVAADLFIEETSSVLESEIKANRWYQLVIRYDGNQVVLFLDGEQVDEYEATGNIDNSHGADFNIGADNESGVFFNGKIDDIYIFDRALTEEEISSLLNAGGTQVENSRPSDFVLFNHELIESRPPNTLVGALAALDEDETDTHTFLLISGNGDDDNSSFRIIDNLLLTTRAFDYETQNSARVRIQVEDNHGGVFTKSITIPIDDVDDDALVAYYPFHGNANDESGNEFHGVANNVALTTNRFGNDESAYNFDGGVLEFINLGSHEHFSVTDELSISMWVKPTSAGDESSFLFDSNQVDVMLTDNLGGIQFDVSSNEGGMGLSDSNTGMGYGNWYHIVVTYDQLTGKIYINNRLIASMIVQDIDVNIPETGLYLGSSVNDLRYKGVIDDVKLYNRAITQAEVEELYNITEYAINNNAEHKADFPVITEIEADGIYVLGSSDYTVSATISDDVGLNSVNMMYKNADTQDFLSMPMTHSNGKYSYTFNDSDFGDLGLIFYIQALDEDNNQTNSIKYGIATLVEGDLEPIQDLTSSKDQLDYAIIAVPYLEQDVAEILENLGDFNDSEWRLAQYTGEVYYLYYPNGFDTFEPGIGYWFLTSRPSDFKLKGGRSVLPGGGQPFTIDVRGNDWNMIGNPYPFAINWQTVIDHNESLGTTVGNLVTYKNRQYNTDQSNLSIYQGALLYSAIDTTIEIPASAKSNSSGRLNGTRRQNDLNNFGIGDWKFGLKISNEHMVYEVAEIAMKNDANSSKGNYNWKLLPRLAKYLDVSFDEGLARSMVPIETEHIWNFTVNSNFREKTTISWDNSGLQNSTHGLMLMDVINQKLVDMTKRSSYTFDMEGEQQPFRLVYGGKDELTDLLELQSSFIGEPYPNPARGKISIPVAFSEAVSNLEVIMYDMMGRAVLKRIYDDFSAGYREIELGYDSTGEKTIEKGIYLLQLKVKSARSMHYEKKRIICE